MSEAAATHHYTCDDLAGFPDDNLRREIIGGGADHVLGPTEG